MRRSTGPLVTALGFSSVLGLGLLATSGQIAGRQDALAGFSQQRRAEIRTGAAAVEILHEHDDDFAVAGAVSTSAPAERLVAWFREIEELQRGKYVPLIHRFSSTPKLEDVASLTLDDEDLEDIRKCRPGDCGLKLSASEILQLNQATQSAPSRWREAAVDAFRSIMVSRVRSFQTNGFRGVPRTEDGGAPVDPAAELEIMLGRFAHDALFTPRVANYLRTYPLSSRGAESFFYWSKDLLGDAKPIISITHLSILHGSRGESTVIVAMQVFATHYLNASVSLTAVTGCGESERQYLVYLRRSRVDVFDRTFGGFVRRLVNKRVRAEGPPLLDAFRMKLESGLPPVNISSSSR